MFLILRFDLVLHVDVIDVLIQFTHLDIMFEFFLTNILIEVEQSFLLD